MRMDLFFIGSVSYCIKGEGASTLFELLYTGGFSPKGVKRCEKTGDISFTLLQREAARFDAVAADTSLEISVRRQHGMPYLFARLLARPGMLVGALLALLLFALAPLFVWEIELEGNVCVSEAELARELCEAGLSRGTFLPHLDTEQVETALRQGDARISYATLNVSGTVVRVQIREGEEAPDNTPRLPANLVATRDGVVTMPLVFEGECLVAEGDVVREGQILASGVRDTQNHGYRVTRAAGEVWARTTYTYEVRVPFCDTEKTYTGQKKHELTLFFFDRARKIFKNTGNSTMECDIIEKIQWLTLPSGKRLPFGFSLVTYLPYTRVDVTHTAMEARAQALEQLDALLATECEGRTLLSRTLDMQVSGDAITLCCTVVCEENIAALSEFELIQK